MELDGVIVFATLAASVGLAFAVAAQDAGAGVAAASGSGAIRLETALTVVAVAAGFLALIVVPLPLGAVTQALIPPTAFEDANAFGVGVFSALLAACIVMVVATLLEQPVPGLLVGAAAFLASTLYWGQTDAFPGGALALALGATFLLPILAGGLSFLAFAAIKRFVHRGRSVRIGTRRALVLGVFLATVMLGALIAFGAGLDWDGPTGGGAFAWLAALAIVLGAGGVASFALGLWMVRRRSWPTDDARGAEAAFSRLTAATAIGLTAALSTFQLIVVAAPAAIVVAGFTEAGGDRILGGGTGSTLRADLLFLFPVLIGAILGILFFSQKTAAKLGEDLSEYTPTQSFSASIGTGASVATAALFGAPSTGAGAVLGGLIGAIWARDPKRIDIPIVLYALLAWIVATLSAVVLTLFFSLVSDALIL